MTTKYSHYESYLWKTIRKYSMRVLDSDSAFGWA